MELTKNYISSLLPKRLKDANKGTFGKVLVIAGSENYPGAAYLSCAAAYRVGVGLVSLATTNDVKIIVSRKLPEVTFLLRNEIEKKLLGYKVLLIGPGLGQKDKARELVHNFMMYPHKMVIDGDGLNLLSKEENWWNKIGRDVVLTPHPGEMSRLTGFSIEKIQQDRENITRQFAKKWQKTIVLKGANTIIASPRGKVAISPFVNPLLATAGTGDVLAGIVAGFLTQGLNTFDAACCGVYVHGVAGETLKEKIGSAGGLASDLLPLIPKALLNISKQRIG
ncbi:MAG: NAD(P)H-hydrate dehydratase [Patescibacteria group bacterium]